MDGRALPGALVTVTVRVTPWIADPTRVAPGRAEVPDPSRAATTVLSATTGTDGVVIVRPDVLVLFDTVALQTASAPPLRTEASLQIDVVFRGIEDRVRSLPIGDRTQATADCDWVLFLDLGLCIIGHVDAGSAVAWFAMQSPPHPGRAFECRLLEMTDRRNAAGANLLSTMLTSSRESAQRAGVQLALGFTPHQLVRQGTMAGGALGLVAVAVGVPLGLVMFRLLSDAVSSGIGVGPGWMPGLGVDVVLVVAVLAVGVSAGLGALASSRTTQRSAADLLRGE